jgi:RecA/RadA recombinase
LNRLYAQYRDQIAFFVVYIQEAHPVDLWQVSSNVTDGVLFASPQTSGERAETAEMCVVKLAIKMPALVDGIDNRVERAYTGWPDRLYIVGTDGRVRYKSAPGPFGFSTANLSQHLEQMLQSSSGQ